MKNWQEAATFAALAVAALLIAVVRAVARAVLG